jgi:pancreatic triacylglycerol lipase
MHMEDHHPIEAEINPTFNALNDIQYHLFTRTNPVIAQRLTTNMDSVRNSFYNPQNPLRFIIHGWQGNARSSMNIDITRELLAKGDMNVIVIDWSAGGDTTIYNNARNNVGAAGGGIARFIDQMNAEGLVQFANIAIIGHNLGGHVAGFTGKQVTRGRIRSIFANSPSLDGFSAGAPTQRY